MNSSRVVYPMREGKVTMSTIDRGSSVDKSRWEAMKSTLSAVDPCTKISFLVSVRSEKGRKHTALLFDRPKPLLPRPSSRFPIRVVVLEERRASKDAAATRFGTGLSVNDTILPTLHYGEVGENERRKKG